VKREKKEIFTEIRTLRQSAYEQTVKFFTGGSPKYSANPKKKTGKRYTGLKSSLDTESASDTESSLDTESTSAPIVGPSTLVVAKSTAKKKLLFTLPKATPTNTIVRPVNRSSLQFRKKYRYRENKDPYSGTVQSSPPCSSKKKKWQKEPARDPLPTQRINCLGLW
jgi:hypothetical protein